MKCFNCGREYDEKNETVACVLIDENGFEAEIKRVNIPDKTLALCPLCVRAVIIGCISINSDYFRSYKIKDFPYEYIEGGVKEND